MNLAIVGYRYFNDYNKFKTIVDNYIKENGVPEYIVSGGAMGVDTMAEKYAKEKNIKVKVFKPDWQKFGKAAGILRNTDIVANSTHVLALPSLKSVGTYDTINKAKNSNKSVTVITIE